MTQLGGIHAVLYALFDKDGEIDLGAMRAQTKLMVEGGAQGVTVLGLATEVLKLSEIERKNVVQAVGRDIAGQAPFSVTVTGNSVTEQRHMVAYALDHGADWIILQPPAVGEYTGDDYLEFFLRVAEGYDCSFAVQNAPQYLGRALSKQDIARLQHTNERFDVVKAEAPAIELAALVAATPKDFTVLNGRGGLEMTDCLRMGAAGFILAPDAIDYAFRVIRLWQNGDYERAEAEYSKSLPAIVFVMQSIEHLICYGKRLFGLRAGFEIHDRSPCLQPTDAGIRLTEHWSAQLGEFKAIKKASSV
jgi:4-hydroxy-tetrahydrodipicolinate synthase